MLQGMDKSNHLITQNGINAHQRNAGANSKSDEAIDKSKSGNMSKLYLAVDSYGLPIEFTIMGGKAHNSKAAKSLIDMLPCANCR